MSNVVLDPPTRPAIAELAAAAASTRGVECPLCGAKPERWCRFTGVDAALHLARFARARSRGRLSLHEMGVVFDACPPVFRPGTLIASPS